MLLHDYALKQLIKALVKRAHDKKHQIVFTTHRESVIEMDDEINIRHIFTTENETLCFNETKPDAISRLTGVRQKPIEIFVEDDLAKAIIHKLASQKKMKKYVSVQKFGAAINSFTAIGGLALKKESLDNVLCVLDGDVYKTQDEREERIRKVIVGDNPEMIPLRDSACNVFDQFILPDNMKPEPYLHSVIRSMELGDNYEFNEIIESAQQIHAVSDSHNFVNKIIEDIGWSQEVGLSKIVDLFALSDSWDNHTANISRWLDSKSAEVTEINGPE